MELISEEHQRGGHVHLHHLIHSIQRWFVADVCLYRLDAGEASIALRGTATTYISSPSSQLGF
jgi:hypothetical protein